MRLLHAFTELPRRALLLLIRGYRLLLSPWLGSSCRFEPTCSLYAQGAIERHGALAGSALAGWRILRCHPWCAGGCDPVPERAPRWFTALLPGRENTSDPPPAAESGPRPHPPARPTAADAGLPVRKTHS